MIITLTGMVITRLLRALCVILMTAPLTGAPLRILAIGDSLTEEYSNPSFSFVYGPNVKNWVELMAQYRSDEVNFGTTGTSNDYRTWGYRLNFGYPGLTAADWVNVVNNVPGGPILLKGNVATRAALITQLPNADVAVVLIGANDLSSVYAGVYNGTAAVTALSDIVNRIDTIQSFLRSQRPTLPIVISTIPDIGATPDRAATYPDPVKRAVARAKIVTLNQQIISLANTRGIDVARIDRLTDRAYDEIPFHLNGTIFTLAGTTNNPPGRVFCADNFHPATVGQALIANEIISACSIATGRTLTPFSNRELLGLLNFDPDGPYNTWLANYPGLGAPTADDDHDGIPNLVEYVLGSQPKITHSVFQFLPSGNGALTFQTSAIALRYASLSVIESEDLDAWNLVPDDRITIGSDGTWTVMPSGAGRAFYRLKAQTRP